MRKLIIAATALAFISSAASAQNADKAGGTTGPAAQSDNASKDDASKMAPKKSSKKVAKKSSKKSGDDTMHQ
jgi:predicted outer membrane protein